MNYYDNSKLLQLNADFITYHYQGNQYVKTVNYCLLQFVWLVIKLSLQTRFVTLIVAITN